jgi:hypothetical protein
LIVEVTQPDIMLSTAPGSQGTQRLKEVTGQVLGSVFFGTLLRIMRESESKGMYGHGGRGEEVFSAQLHDIIAERLGMKLKTPLSEAIHRSLEGQQQRLDRQQSTPSGSAQELDVFDPPSGEKQ